MEARQRLDRLDLDHNSITNEEIQSVACIECHAAVGNR